MASCQERRHTNQIMLTTITLYLWLRLFASRRFLSSSGPGPGQMRVRKVRVRLVLAFKNSKLKDLDLSYTINLLWFSPTTHPPSLRWYGMV